MTSRGDSVEPSEGDALPARPPSGLEQQEGHPPPSAPPRRRPAAPAPGSAGRGAGRTAAVPGQRDRWGCRSRRRAAGRVPGRRFRSPGPPPRGRGSRRSVTVEALKGRVRVPQGHGGSPPGRGICFRRSSGWGPGPDPPHRPARTTPLSSSRSTNRKLLSSSRMVPPVVAGIGPEPGEDGIGLTLGQIVAAGGGLVDGVLGHSSPRPDTRPWYSRPGRRRSDSAAPAGAPAASRAGALKRYFMARPPTRPGPWGRILYPWPQTTLIYRGSEGLISIFSRRWRMWTATALSDPAPVSFQTDS